MPDSTTTADALAAVTINLVTTKAGADDRIAVTTIRETLRWQLGVAPDSPASVAFDLMMDDFAAAGARLRKAANRTPGGKTTSAKQRK